MSGWTSWPCCSTGGGVLECTSEFSLPGDATSYTIGACTAPTVAELVTCLEAAGYQVTSTGVNCVTGTYTVSAPRVIQSGTITTEGIVEVDIIDPNGVVVATSTMRTEGINFTSVSTGATGTYIKFSYPRAVPRDMSATIESAFDGEVYFSPQPPAAGARTEPFEYTLDLSGMTSPNATVDTVAAGHYEYLAGSATGTPGASLLAGDAMAHGTMFEDVNAIQASRLDIVADTIAGDVLRVDIHRALNTPVGTDVIAMNVLNDPPTVEICDSYDLTIVGPESFESAEADATTIAATSTECVCA